MVRRFNVRRSADDEAQAVVGLTALLLAAIFAGAALCCVVVQLSSSSVRTGSSPPTLQGTPLARPTGCDDVFGLLLGEPWQPKGAAISHGSGLQVRQVMGREGGPGLAAGFFLRVSPKYPICGSLAVSLSSPYC